MADDPRQWRPVGQLYVPPPPPVGPLRALLADEDRAELLLQERIYHGTGPSVTWTAALSAARAVLAALREVAGL